LKEAFLIALPASSRLRRFPAYHALFFSSFSRSARLLTIFPKANILPFIGFVLLGPLPPSCLVPPCRTRGEARSDLRPTRLRFLVVEKRPLFFFFPLFSSYDYVSSSSTRARPVWRTSPLFFGFCGWTCACNRSSPLHSERFHGLFPFSGGFLARSHLWGAAAIVPLPFFFPPPLQLQYGIGN